MELFWQFHTDTMFQLQQRCVKKGRTQRLILSPYMYPLWEKQSHAGETKEERDNDV